MDLPAAKTAIVHKLVVVVTKAVNPQNTVTATLMQGQTRSTLQRKNGHVAVHAAIAAVRDQAKMTDSTRKRMPVGAITSVVINRADETGSATGTTGVTHFPRTRGLYTLDLERKECIHQA